MIMPLKNPREPMGKLLNIIRLSMLPKLINQFSTIPIKMPIFAIRQSDSIKDLP